MANSSSKLPPTRRGPVRAVLVSLRPAQWVKNLFVFGPLLFSKHLVNPVVNLRALWAFGVFCVASSAVYLLNDVTDARADRLHPTKRYRPVASGELSPTGAMTGVIILALVALAGAVLLDRLFALMVIGYIILNMAYSAGLKRMVIVDVMLIGAGFVIRVLAGAAAIGVSPSHWLVLCTILLSVFLGFTKRRAELRLLQDEAVEHREVLTNYNASFLDQMISVVTAATLICYILYTVDARTMEDVTAGGRGLLLTVPLVMYGIFRYLYLVYHQDQGGSPTTAVMKDRMMVGTLVLWALLCMAVIYYPQYFRNWFS